MKNMSLGNCRFRVCVSQLSVNVTKIPEMIKLWRGRIYFGSQFSEVSFTSGTFYGK